MGIDLSRLKPGDRADVLKHFGQPDKGETSAAPPVKRSKYRNTVTECAGQVFDSAKEAQRYVELALKQSVGEIKGLKRQVPFAFEVNGEKVFDWIADFTYYETWERPIGDETAHALLRVIEDVKGGTKKKAGTRTPVYLLKKKLIEAQYRCVIREV